MENIKAIAAEFLNGSKVVRLPVDVTRIKVAGKSCIIGTYTNYDDVLRQYKLKAYSETVPAFSIEVGENECFILYSDTLSYSERNPYIAHEIGHIVLGHTVCGHICGKSTDPNTQDRQEKESDAFAVYLLTLACVLFAAGITGQREIARAACVSDELAWQAAAEISRLKDYKQTADEERLCKQFRSFIFLNRYRKPLKFLKCATAILVIAAACFMITVNYINKDIPADEIIPIYGNQSIISNNYDVVDNNLNKLSYMENKVYVSLSGKKFHKESCPTIKNNQNLTDIQ